MNEQATIPKKKVTWAQWLLYVTITGGSIVIVGYLFTKGTNLANKK